MASDPMQLIGLYLDLKARRERAARDNDQLLTQGLNAGLKAAESGDLKLALSALAVGSQNRDTPEMRDLVSSVAKQRKKQLAAAEQAAQVKAATPNAQEQTDVAKGAASLLNAPGDPRLNALAALRSIPPSYPPEIGNRLAMRAGSIGANRAERAEAERTRMRDQASITDEYRQRREGRSDAKGGKKSKDTAAVDSAWETYLDSGMSFDEWRRDPDLPKSVVANAMKHPGYVKMLRERRWKGVPFARPDQVAAPPIAATAPTEIKTPFGVLREKK